MAPPCNRLPLSFFILLYLILILSASRFLAPTSEYTTYTLAKLQTLSTLIIIFIR